MTNKRISSTWLALGTIVLLFAGFILVLWSVGLFDFSGTDPSAKIVAASLALVGGMITAVVSIFGILLKNSLDNRIADINEQAERRLQIDADRNAALAHDAEERLKLEAGIRAIGLLSTREGKLVPMAQRAGALFTLASLRRYELALDLTSKLLTDNELDALTAASILNRALLSGETIIQRNAINILRYHIEQMLLDDGKTVFPLSIMHWEPGLSDYVREWATIALGEVLVARPLGEWNPHEITTIIAALGVAWMTEKDDTIKNQAGVLLRSILPASPTAGTISHPRATIDTRQILKEVSTLPPSDTLATRELVERLRVWAEGEEYERPE